MSLAKDLDGRTMGSETFGMHMLRTVYVQPKVRTRYAILIVKLEV